MFPLQNHHQATFVYGPEIYEKLVPEDHILCRINKQVDFSFVNEACKDLYSQNQGRPVIYLPEIMFRSAIVQYLNDYSDRDMEEAARYNIIIKWFIGIPIEDHSYDHSALGDFRDRLGENRWKKLFFIILKQIEDAGFAKGNHSVDASHVIANIAIPGTIGLIRQGIKAIMEEIEKIDPKLYEELGGKKTADKKEKIHTLKLEEKKKKLVEVVEEARAIRGKAEKLESPSVNIKIEQLNQILNENIEEKKGKIQKKKEHVKDKLVNIVDKDARHGAKSDSKPFTGYKANLMKSDDGFVTNIIGTAGNTYDGNILVSLVDEKTENSSKPSKIAGDTHYGSAENRYQMLQRGITIVAPINEDFNPTGLLSQEKFVLDKTGVTCPAGNRTMISNYNEKEGTTIFYFKKEICKQCSLKDQCTKQEGRTITIGKHHELMMEAKEYNKTQAFKDDMKERAHIEPKHAEMKRFHGMARARYWGLPKVNIQFIITAIVVNVKRLANVIGSVCYLKPC
ncbi:MAG: IS1182 family transposase [Candidatus Methanoperedens sp.]|nr:IS1182 family transposase [Candidatus Methanoperedens sp.]